VTAGSEHAEFAEGGTRWSGWGFSLTLRGDIETGHRWWGGRTWATWLVTMGFVLAGLAGIGDLIGCLRDLGK